MKIHVLSQYLFFPTDTCKSYLDETLFSATFLLIDFDFYIFQL